MILQGEGYEGVIAEPTAGARVEDVTNVKTIEGPLKPMGRVVGIIKRNWRVYCGVLQVRVALPSSWLHLAWPLQR